MKTSNLDVGAPYKPGQKKPGKTLDFDIKHRAVGAIMLILPWLLLLFCALEGF